MDCATGRPLPPHGQSSDSDGHPPLSARGSHLNPSVPDSPLWRTSALRRLFVRIHGHWTHGRRHFAATSEFPVNAAEPTAWTADEIAEWNAAQRAEALWWEHEDRAMWRDEGTIRRACSGCGAEMYVPLLCAASPAYCHHGPYCFPDEF